MQLAAKTSLPFFLLYLHRIPCLLLPAFFIQDPRFPLGHRFLVNDDPPISDAMRDDVRGILETTPFDSLQRLQVPFGVTGIADNQLIFDVKSG